jgi:choline-sulfatase
MIDRRTFLQGAGAAVAASLLPSWAKEQGPYNVLIVKSDEHNPLYTSVHGHPFIKTPNMQRLARMGTVFENNYCSSPLCLPSRSSFISGRRVFEIQTYGNCNVFYHDYPSYGKVLRDQGVHSVHVGKVDAYNHSSTLGFSEMIQPTDRAQPGDTAISRTDIRNRAEARANFGPRDNPYGGDEKKTEVALEWLATKAPKMQQPWTMEVNLIKPHFPLFTTRELWDMYPQGADLPKYGKDCETAMHPYAQDLRKFFGTDGFNEADIRGMRRGYLGCVTFIDRELGKILDAVERAGLSKNTVIAYTSDHGEMLGKFGMWWKRSLFEDSARVPAIVAGPGFRSGARVKTATDTLDLQATIFRAVGAKRPSNWSGTPLQDIAPNDSNRAVFCEYQDGGTRASAFMIRKGRWKLLYHCAAPHLLFDLEKDPNELTNLYKERRDVAEDLKKELRKICSPEDENRRAEEFIQKELKAIAEMGSRGKRKNKAA